MSRKMKESFCDRLLDYTSDILDIAIDIADAGDNDFSCKIMDALASLLAAIA